jgi:hypothetical protein
MVCPSVTIFYHFHDTRDTCPLCEQDETCAAPVKQTHVVLQYPTQDNHVHYQCGCSKQYRRKNRITLSYSVLPVRLIYYIVARLKVKSTFGPKVAFAMVDETGSCFLFASITEANWHTREACGLWTFQITLMYVTVMITSLLVAMV